MFCLNLNKVNNVTLNIGFGKPNFLSKLIGGEKLSTSHSFITHADIKKLALKWSPIFY